MSRPRFAPLREWPRAFLRDAVRRQRQGAGMVEIQGHHLFAPALHRDSVVIDGGAHTGEFSRELCRRFGCRCYALEPVPELQAQIGAEPGLQSFALALDAHDGESVLHLASNPQANSLHPELAAQFGARQELRIATTSLATFLRRQGLAGADLLKLDIEGAELAVLDGADDETLQSFGQITVEFHDFVPGFQPASAIAAVKRRLRRCGFQCVVFSRASGNHADTLFLNRGKIRLTPRQRLHLSFGHRLTLEMARGLARLRSCLG